MQLIHSCIGSTRLDVAMTHLVLHGVEFQELCRTHIPLGGITIASYQLLGNTKQFIDQSFVSGNTFNDSKMVGFTSGLVFYAFSLRELAHQTITGIST
ncbi:hypothetical protein D3C72_2306790 [compost metagenome]